MGLGGGGGVAKISTQTPSSTYSLNNTAMKNLFTRGTISSGRVNRSGRRWELSNKPTYIHTSSTYSLNSAR